MWGHPVQGHRDQARPSDGHSPSESRLIDNDRDAYIVARRRDHIPFRQIGLELGISHQRVYQLYQRILAEEPASGVDQLRAEQGALVERAYRTPLAIAEDPRMGGRNRVEALNSLARWADRQARLFGLDRPIQSRVELVTEDDVDRAIASLQEELRIEALEARAQGISWPPEGDEP